MNPTTKNCEICNSQISLIRNSGIKRSPSEMKRTRFCSNECRGIHVCGRDAPDPTEDELKKLCEEVRAKRDYVADEDKQKPVYVMGYK